jgi:hypothetical protein
MTKRFRIFPSLGLSLALISSLAASSDDETTPWQEPDKPGSAEAAEFKSEHMDLNFMTMAQIQSYAQDDADNYFDEHPAAAGDPLKCFQIGTKRAVAHRLHGQKLYIYQFTFANTLNSMTADKE